MKRDIDILTTDECHSLLSACSKAPTGIRNRAMVVVLWRACLRIKEALSLLPKDVTQDSIRVHSGKGGRARTVGLDPEASAVVWPWISKLQGTWPQSLSTALLHPKGRPYRHILLSAFVQAAGGESRVR